MQYLEAVVLLLGAILAEVLGVLGGFGSSSFFVPVASWFYDFQTVLVLTGLLHVFSNSSKLVLFRQHLDKRLFWLFVLPGIGFVVLGAWLSSKIESPVYQLLLGILLMSLSLLLLIKPKIKLPAHTGIALMGGGLAGFVTGLLGTGGAIRGLALAAFDLEKNVFVATSSLTDLVTDTSRTAVYLYQGYLKPEYYVLVGVLFVGAWLGSYTGKRILEHVSQQRFRQMSLALVLMMGGSLVVAFFR